LGKRLAQANKNLGRVDTTGAYLGAFSEKSQNT
jgi:hypothetical protein